MNDITFTAGNAGRDLLREIETKNTVSTKNIKIGGMPQINSGSYDKCYIRFRNPRCWSIWKKINDYPKENRILIRNVSQNPQLQLCNNW